MRRFRHAVTAALVAAIGMGSAQDGVGGPSAIQPALDEWGIRTIMTLSRRSWTA